MKKLFTLIGMICAIIPATYSMDTSFPADIQKQHDNLTVLIQNADVNAFKSAFGAVTLPTATIAALRQTITEIKTAVTNELNTMNSKTKNWSKIAKGGLTTIGGFWASISGPALYCFLQGNNIHEKIKFALVGLSIPTIAPSFLAIKSIETIKKPYIVAQRYKTCITIINALTCLGIAYKAIPHGIKTFTAGLNYKKHLQSMLDSLDAIDTYIVQTKA